MVDVVICVALKDCNFLNKNLYFIEKNINPQNIYIITDRRNYRYIAKKIYKSVILIDENSLIDDLSFSVIKNLIKKNLKYQQYGWYFQQFLKLGFSKSKWAKNEYLVWDSDTVPFNSLSFHENGRSLFSAKWEHNEEYFETIDHLMHLPIKADYSFISEHMLFNTVYVKEMLEEIEKKENGSKPWFQIIIENINHDAKNGFSEFETYGTFLLNRYPNSFKIRRLRTFRYCGRIYGIFATRNEIEMLSSELDTGSFEAYDYPMSLWRRLRQKLHFNLCKLITIIRHKNL